MTMGREAARKIADAAADAGAPIPDSCLPPVVLDSRLERLLNAFWELSSCRSIGFGVMGPIPWDRMDAYARAEGLAEDYEGYQDFMVVIRALDEEFLAVQSDRQEQARAKAEAEARAKSRGRGRGGRAVSR